jgi:hypothetical protein
MLWIWTRSRSDPWSTSGRGALRWRYDRTLWSARAIWNMTESIHMNPGAGWAVRACIGLARSSAAFYRSRTPGPLAVNLEKIPRNPQ